MTRTFFAISVAALMLGAIPMTSQAAPIAPLTGVAVSHDNLTQTVACYMRKVCSRTRGEPKVCH
jgi:hypothetical protein